MALSAFNTDTTQELRAEVENAQGEMADAEAAYAELRASFHEVRACFLPGTCILSSHLHCLNTMSRHEHFTTSTAQSRRLHPISTTNFYM